MRRSLIRAFWPLLPLSLLAFSATALADDPEGLTLSASSTREACTLGSVTTLIYDIQGGQPPYQLTVDGQTVEQSSDPHYIRCRASAPWSSLGPPGSDHIQRLIISVSDATGARAYAVAEHPLVLPLPAPRNLQIDSDPIGSAVVRLSAEWIVRALPGDERTGDVAIRWRSAGSAKWNVEQQRPQRSSAFRYRASWRVEPPGGGEWRELQVAEIRHALDLQTPEALRWSTAVSILIPAPPHELQAEATHDSITLTWGPQASGLEYVARLRAIDPRGHGFGQTLRLTTGPVFEARFSDLLPDSLYRVEVALVDAWPSDQHQFEMRTETAPEGWLGPTRQATDVGAAFEKGDIVVTWTPPETGSRRETRVCARPSDETENFASWRCETVEPGRASARLAHAFNDLPGGFYQIQVITLTSPEGVANTLLHLPTYRADTPTRGEPPTALRFSDVFWNNVGDSIYPRYLPIWTFDWPMQGAELAELSWRERDREFLRETRQTKSADRETGEFRIVTGFDVRPLMLRIRLLRDGAWTPWSRPVDAPDVGGPIFSLVLNQSADGIEAQCERPGIGTEIDGYRLYVSRNRAHDSVIEVGAPTRATIPILPNDEDYFVRVVSYDEEHGEGGSGYAWYTRRAQPQALRIGLRQASSWCPPVPGGRIRVHWTIEGGTPPFTVSIADRLGFETEQRSGVTTVACPERTIDGQASLRAHVLDANGRSSHRTAELEDLYEVERGVDEDPFAVHVNMRSVHRDHVLLRWDCWYLPYTAVLRWRLTGERGWKYETSFPQWRGGYGDFRCRGTWSNLRPGTTYEYQLAHYEREAQLRRPDLLQWTETQTVTTLGPAQELTIERDGGTITVSWQRQPDAWAYVVGLRAVGRSWWKRYEPSGEPFESLTFRGVPRELELRVALISPPLEDGEEARPAWFDEVVVTGE